MSFHILAAACLPESQAQPSTLSKQLDYGTRLRIWTNTKRKLSYFVIVSHLHWYCYTDTCHCYVIRLWYLGLT